MQHEWQRYLAERVVWFGLISICLLIVTSVTLSKHAYQQTQLQISKVQTITQKQWDTQPDRHPHRVAHFGDFVFKPVSELALFDPGVSLYTGHVLFLEAHRQNSANFNSAAESSALMRFGTLTPAFIVQVILPLMLIFIGFNTVTSEIESGTLQQLVSAGISLKPLLLGKVFALFLPLFFATLVLAIAGLFIPSNQPDNTLRLGVLFISYNIYLLTWCLIIVCVSSFNQKSHQSLLILVLLWLLTCIALPRIMPELANQTYPTISKVEAEFSAEQKLKKIGDSHNPDDPHYARFKQSILKKYGVTNTEDLPINYPGLLMAEGERLTAQVYSEQQNQHNLLVDQQNNLSAKLAWLSPMNAIQILSRAAAGTDFHHHLDFLTKAEQRRYAMIQSINDLHAYKVKPVNEKDQRLSAHFWHDVPRPNITLGQLNLKTNTINLAFGALIIWCSVLVLLAYKQFKRLEKT